MTNLQRKGQRLINYIWEKRIPDSDKNRSMTMEDFNRLGLDIERMIFYMSDKEFEEAMKFGDSQT